MRSNYHFKIAVLTMILIIAVFMLEICSAANATETAYSAVHKYHGNIWLPYFSGVCHLRQI